MTAPPVRYSDDVETFHDDESETIQGMNRAFDTILTTTAQSYGHAVRSVHAKAHAILQGVLTVDAGLPPELAQGVFAKPGEHKVYMRMSTNAGDVLPDAIGLPRGLALKVLDVDGERLPGAQGRAQDFIMINGPVFQTKTSKQFLSNLKLLAGTTEKGEGAKVALSQVLQGVNKALTAVGVESPKIQSLGGAPNIDPLGETYYSVTPFRYGEHIAKFSLVPVSTDLTDRTDQKIPIEGRENAIRETVREEMGGVRGVWELRVQLCRDLQKQPIEDSTVEWKEDEAPSVRVATVTVAPQDSWDPACVQRVDEEMRFGVWTGLAAHRPLGNINRARNETYLSSAQFRTGFNRCPIHEPGADPLRGPDSVAAAD